MILTATQFNERFPVGTEMGYMPPGAEDFTRCVTESEAWTSEYRMGLLSIGPVVRINIKNWPVEIKYLIDLTQKGTE